MISMIFTQPKTSLEPTPVGAFRSAFAFDIGGPAWLSWFCAEANYANNQAES
jgi:hypothetical protein